MCGIAGMVRTNSHVPMTREIITRMLTVIQHRGPDESGFYIDNSASIANVRLSIIDIASGKQPMLNSTGKLWIVFNGEIFNYIELREELLKLGHHFKTESDTEVLLHIYEEYGAEGLSKLNGQFVFAIWNSESKELFIARDRVGIRPLFYTMVDNSIVFASEIKAILEHPSVSPEIDPKAISQLFTFWTPLPGKTPFLNINELEPGCYMIFKNGILQTKKYWSLEFASPENYLNISVNEAAEELRFLLTDAVKLRLRSDVPVAAYLSGGIDSSVTTALIKDVSPQHLQTFSIGFADAGYDETVFQKEVSAFLNTKHTAFTCTSQDIADAFPAVVWYSESPVFRTAPAPMFLLSKKVRENNIKVVITGEGADEMLAGYDIFKEAMIRRFWAKYPSSKYRPLLLRNLYPYIPQIQSMNAGMLKFVFGYKLEEINNPFYAHLLRWNNGSHIRRHFSESFLEQIKEYDPHSDAISILPDNYTGWDPLSQAQYVETKLLMSNYLLSSQGDRMGMGNSIEGRYPFLDYRVMEFAAKLPPSYKMKGLNEKYILKKAMAGRIPESVLKRSKQAYRAPITSVFVGKQKPGYVSELLNEQSIRNFGIFDNSQVDKLLKKFDNQQGASENDTMALTAILSTQMFYAMYIQKTYRPVAEKALLKPVITDKQNSSITIQ